MKKNILWGILISGLLFLTGCSSNQEDIIKKLTNKIEKMNSYHIEGILEVTNNETTYKYDIDVAYEEDENFRVSLKNQTNNHEQIILKNESGVYVLTPSLNKSFKFQSEWPYNNSQSYLYQTILEDIKKDKEAKSESTSNGYTITTTVNYSNNKELISQKIYLDKKANITKVEVLDKNGIVKIKMTYSKVDTKAKFDDDYFELSGNMNITKNEPSKTENKEETTAKIDDIVYPLYIPNNTYLESQDTMKTDSGERIILTFAGENPFTLIEETAKVEDNYATIPVYGDLEFINDSIGNITETTATWSSNGIEYYAVSDKLDKDELLQVVNSVNVLPVGK